MSATLSPSGSTNAAASGGPYPAEPGPPTRVGGRPGSIGHYATNTLAAHGPPLPAGARFDTVLPAPSALCRTNEPLRPLTDQDTLVPALITEAVLLVM